MGMLENIPAVTGCEAETHSGHVTGPWQDTHTRSSQHDVCVFGLWEETGDTGRRGRLSRSGPEPNPPVMLWNACTLQQTDKSILQWYVVYIRFCFPLRANLTSPWVFSNWMTSLLSILSPVFVQGGPQVSHRWDPSPTQPNKYLSYL